MSSACASSTTTPTKEKPKPYQRRHPERTPAYQVVQQHLETYLARRQEEDSEGIGIPTYIERDLRNFLECGILAYGFARARCDACGHDFLIAFSCKGRGICPSCNTKRMVEIAMHLVDDVLPEAPLRQIVVAFPKWLRYYLNRDTDLFNRVIRICQSEIERALQKHSVDAPEGSRCGGIVFIHRFGSSLNLHPHCHFVLIDGVIASDEQEDQAENEGLRFYPTAPLNKQAVEGIREAIRTRILRLFKRRKLLEPEVIENFKHWNHGGGFSVHADVQIPAFDKAGRERLLRYCARPLFAGERLRWIANGEKLHYQLNKPNAEGKTALILTPDEFLDRIVALIPPPRKHRHRYFGVFAPNSPWRKRVIARAGLPIETPLSQSKNKAIQAETLNGANAEETCNDDGFIKTCVSLWAILMARIYEIFPLSCPDCGGQMRIIAFIEDIEPVQRILNHIGEPTEAPPIHPARSPPIEWDFDQTGVFDDSNQDIDEYEFDQTVKG